MIPPEAKPQLPKPEIKLEQKILKAQFVEEHVEKIQDLQSYEQHEHKISTLVLETTNKVGTLNTCRWKVVGFNDEEDVKGFDCELSVNFECLKDLKAFNDDCTLNLNGWVWEVNGNYLVSKEKKNEQVMIPKVYNNS